MRRFFENGYVRNPYGYSGIKFIDNHISEIKSSRLNARIIGSKGPKTIDPKGKESYVIVYDTTLKNGLHK